MSSLKRKTAGNASSDASKKPKIDFFAPRTTKAASNSDEESSTFFSFKPPPDACVRLTTWNVNGIMSVNEKVLKKYLEAEDPAILILTETKYAKGKPDLMCLKSRFKYQYWGVDPRAGHAGTAVLSKFKPLKVSIGLPDWEETSGRFVELEFEQLYVVGTYVPNSGENFKTMDLKRKWNSALKSHLQRLKSQKPVVWGGDFNSIMSKKDLDSTAQTFWNQMSGLSEEERVGFGEILKPVDSNEPTFVDVWRHLHPTEEEYTHSSSKFGSWRLDSFITSATLLEKVNLCVIRNELKDLNLSDHWPVTLDMMIDMSPKLDAQKES